MNGWHISLNFTMGVEFDGIDRFGRHFLLDPCPFKPCCLKLQQFVTILDGVWLSNPLLGWALLSLFLSLFSHFLLPKKKDIEDAGCGVCPMS